MIGDENNSTEIEDVYWKDNGPQHQRLDIAHSEAIDQCNIRSTIETPIEATAEHQFVDEPEYVETMIVMWAQTGLLKKLSTKTSPLKFKMLHAMTMVLKIRGWTLRFQRLLIKALYFKTRLASA